MSNVYFIAILALVCVGCDDTESAETIDYVNLVVDAPGENEGGAVVMTSANCTSDADSGFFQGSFAGEDGSRLEIKIKGFSTAGGQYTCTQASDNASGDVGMKYDQCAIELTIPNGDSTLNSYAMHRRGTEIRDFEYGGACTISMNYQEPTLTGTIDCAGLVQTDLEGAPRNPIDPSVTASITSASKFFCDL